MGWKKCLVLFALLISSAKSRAETWNIVVDEFPPYSCVRCPDGGAGVKALRQALRTVNVEVAVTYLPFVHVLREVKSQKYIGYFSWTASMQPGFITPTKPVFMNRLVFVENKDHPLVWQTLSDLKGKRIGLYEGSGYFPEFMDLVKAGVIIGVTYPSDTTRIRLVAQGKLDGALMDRDNAIFYFKELPLSVRKKVQLNDSVLHIQGTYFVLQEKQKEKMETLEKALKNVNTQSIVDEYIKKYLKPYAQ